MIDKNLLLYSNYYVMTFRKLNNKNNKNNNGI